MWLRAVLVQHASYLMTVPGLMRKMSRLYQVRACFAVVATPRTPLPPPPRAASLGPLSHGLGGYTTRE